MQVRDGIPILFKSGGGRHGERRQRWSDRGAGAMGHLRDARRMMDARTSVPTAASPPTIAMPM